MAHFLRACGALQADGRRQVPVQMHISSRTRLAAPVLVGRPVAPCLGECQVFDLSQPDEGRVVAWQMGQLGPHILCRRHLVGLRA